MENTRTDPKFPRRNILSGVAAGALATVANRPRADLGSASDGNTYEVQRNIAEGRPMPADHRSIQN